MNRLITASSLALAGSAAALVLSGLSLSPTSTGSVALPDGQAADAAGSPGLDAPRLDAPSGLALAPDGRIVVADRRLHRIFALDLETGALAPIAGTGASGFSGDGGPAPEAELRNPEWVDYARDGDLLIADRGNSRIRRVDAGTGLISTIAGTGTTTAAGDGGPATAASLTYPFGVVAGPSGDVYVFDTEVHSIRRIDAASGIIRTVVGTGEGGFSGESGPGTAVSLSRPHNGVFDREGRLVFGDSFNQRIRRWDPETGRVETLAGAGQEGVSAPGTPAAEARFTYFGALAEEPDGSILYTGLEGRIMRIRASASGPGFGALEHVAGTGTPGFAGDGGPATEARLAGPYGLLRLPNGDLVFSDMGNGRIRRIDATTGVIETVAGP